MSLTSWPLLSLGEAGVALIDCEHRTPASAGTGRPYIAIPQVRYGRLDLSEARLISDDDFVEWTRKARPQAYDVILSRRCNPGETAFVPPRLECALGQNLVLLRADGSKVRADFLRWLVRSPAWWEQVRRFLNVGAVFDSLKCADIPRFELPIPPADDQQRIVAMLGALDDKIELNRRMNETLEAICRTILRRAIGKADSAVRIEEVATVNAFQLRANDSVDHIDYVEISKVTRGEIVNVVRYERGSEPSRAKRRVKHGDTVISTVRPDRRSYFLALNPPATLIVSTGFAVVSPNEVPWSFMHLALTEPSMFDALGRLADGGAYPAVRPALIASLEIPIIAKAQLTRFHEAAAPLLERVELNRRESRTLAQLRDTLLPKLLTGELRAREAEREVAEVV